MSLLSLLVQQRKTQIVTQAAVSVGPPQQFILEIDAAIQITHEKSASATKNPVEDGSQISDHVTLENDKLTIEGMVSSSPIGIFQSIGNLAGSSISQNAILSGIGGALGGTVAGLLQSTGDRVQNAFKFLEEIHFNRIPFKIVTGLKVYDPVILTTLTIPQNAQIGPSLRFTATFEQITIATADFVDIPVTKVDPTVENTATSKTKLGKQSTPPATQTTQERSTILLNLFKKAGAGFTQ